MRYAERSPRFSCEDASSARAGAFARAARGAEGRAGRPGPGLGKSTKSLDAWARPSIPPPPERPEVEGIFDKGPAPEGAGERRARNADQRWSGLISPPRKRSGETPRPSRVSACCWNLGYMADGVAVAVSPESGRAAWRGLIRCGSVWLCPNCSRTISQTRREELNAALAWGRERGLVPALLTFTMRHAADDRLGESLGAMKTAMTSLRQSRKWRALPLIGTVTTTEITHGWINGWHPHFHLIAFLDAGTSLDVLEPLRAEWLRSLCKIGRDGAGAAFDVRDATAAGSYIAKWGAGEELALQGQKQGRRGSRTPWALLRDSRLGDEDATTLWREYAQATRGRRQLVWSRGLKELVGLTEIGDDEAAQEKAGDGVVMKRFTLNEWRAQRKRRVWWLEECERQWASMSEGERAALVEAQRRRSRPPDGDVQEDHPR